MSLDQIPRHVQASSEVVKILGPSAISTILDLVCMAYHLTKDRDAIQPGMDEWEINEQLSTAIAILSRHLPEASFAFCPLPEKPIPRSTHGKGKPSSIDISFKYGFNRDVYYGMECKILREGDHNLYREYIKNGVERFVSGTYSREMHSAAMIGYVMLGSLKTVGSDIARRLVQSASTITVRSGICVGDLQDCLESAHRRSLAAKAIRLSHLMLDYCAG